MNSSRKCRVVYLSQRRSFKRATAQIQVPSNSEHAAADPLQLLRSPIGNDVAPTMNSDGRDSQSRSDGSDGFEVSENDALQHRPNLMKVNNVEQLSDFRSAANRRMGGNPDNVLSFTGMKTTLKQRYVECIAEKPHASREEIAAGCGLSVVALHYIVTGKTKKVRRGTLAKSAKYFGVHEEWLNYGKGPKYADDVPPSIRESLQQMNAAMNAFQLALQNMTRAIERHDELQREQASQPPKKRA